MNSSTRLQQQGQPLVGLTDAITATVNFFNSMTQTHLVNHNKMWEFYTGI